MVQLQSLIDNAPKPGESQPAPDENQLPRVVWEPNRAAEDFVIQIAEGSIRPMSETALRGMVIELKKAGLIDTAHALQMLDVPDWEEIAQAIQKELELAALARVTRTK
jgi:hypothetical protein